MIYLKLLLACVLAYLVGSISFSVIIGKIFANIDIRHKGSKKAPQMLQGLSVRLRVL